MLFCFVGFFFCLFCLFNKYDLQFLHFTNKQPHSNSAFHNVHVAYCFSSQVWSFFLSVSFFSPVDLQHTKHQHIYCFMLKWCCWNVINFYWEECPFCSQWKCHKTALWLTNISANNLTDLKMSLLCSSAL